MLTANAISLCEDALMEKEQDLFPDGRDINTVLAAVRKELEAYTCVNTVDWIKVDEGFDWQTIDIGLSLNKEMPPPMLDSISRLIESFGYEIGYGTVYSDKDQMIDFLTDSLFYRLDYDVRYKEQLF